MYIFKKSIHTFIKNESPEILKNRLSSNIVLYDEFRHFKRSKTDKIFQGSIANTFFILNDLNEGNSSLITEYEGNINPYNSGSEIIITASTPPQIKALLYIAISFCFALFVIPAIIKLFLNNEFTSFDFSSFTIVIPILIIFVLNNIRSTTSFGAIEKLFE